MSAHNVTYSHYDRKKRLGKELELHSREVAEAACISVPPFLHFDGIHHEQVKLLLELQGQFHDLGKYTDYFQHYLVRGVSSVYKHHAHISALLFYRYMKANYAHLDIHADIQDCIYFLFYIMIRRHHNSLTIDKLFPLEDLPVMQEELKVQMRNLRKKAMKLSRVYSLSKEQFELLFSMNDVLEDKDFRQRAMEIRKLHRHERWYFLMLYSFSQLVDKDKASAANLSQRSRIMFSPDMVLNHIGRKSKNSHSALNEKRNRARETIMKQINALSDEDIQYVRIFTLTAPTGLGKTLASLQAAFRLCERIGKIYGYTPRIISAVPFINIIEQTKTDYAAILQDRGTLNVHHRLADKKLLSGGAGEEDIPIEKAMLEVDSWEGDVVLTTFVQLFQSLFTGDNASLKKVNKLAGSIVILDEVQSIPEKYMPVIGAVIIKISEYFGTRFILMTATQPYLLQMGRRLLDEYAVGSGSAAASREGIPLLPDYVEYFRQENRTKLVPSFNSILDTDSFLAFFKETWGKRSAVIVANTIRRCVELYNKIKDEFSDQAAVYHLSTNLIPKERKRVINEVINALNDKKKIILVSTQTIEAGVDLDFQVGYRDLAPLESIIQTAGRVNRNANERDEYGHAVACPVYIMQLETDHQLIYKLHHLDRTKKLLEHKGEIAEASYLELVDTYYQAMRDNISKESRDLWEGIMTLDFAEIAKFQFIPDDQTVVDIFIEFDDSASKLATAYEMIRLENGHMDIELLRNITGENIILDDEHKLSSYQKKALINLLLSRMSEYMVQVRLQRYLKLKALPFNNRGGVEATFCWVPENQLEEFYDKEVGYGVVEEARMW